MAASVEATCPATVFAGARPASALDGHCREPAGGVNHLRDWLLGGRGDHRGGEGVGDGLDSGQQLPLQGH